MVKQKNYNFLILLVLLIGTAFLTIAIRNNINLRSKAVSDKAILHANFKAKFLGENRGSLPETPKVATFIGEVTRTYDQLELLVGSDPNDAPQATIWVLELKLGLDTRTGVEQLGAFMLGPENSQILVGDSSSDYHILNNTSFKTVSEVVKMLQPGTIVVIEAPTSAEKLSQTNDKSLGHKVALTQNNVAFRDRAQNKETGDTDDLLGSITALYFVK